jgi:hypothetical protein
MTTVLKSPEADGTIRIACAGGAMLEAPIWETHHRGTNYLAVIGVDPTMPGGLSRRFINKGRGDCFYLTEQLAVGDAREFAGDYTTSVGARKRERLYGVVVEKTDRVLVVKPYEKGILAVVAAEELRRARDEESAPQRIRVV